MRKFITLVCVAFLATTAQAQITWNVKGGIGAATCYGDVEDMSNHLVGKLGVGIEKPISKNWSIMPSLELAWKGAEYKSTMDYGYYGSDYESIKETLDIFYLQIPIVAAYRINLNSSWNITLKAGPYFAYGLSGRMKGSSEGSYGSDSWDEDIFKGYDYGKDGDSKAGKRFDAGLDFGVDFEYHRFVFGAEYELGLLKFAPDDADVKNAAAYFTVGYKF